MQSLSCLEASRSRVTTRGPTLTPEVHGLSIPARASLPLPKSGGVTSAIARRQEIWTDRSKRRAERGALLPWSRDRNRNHNRARVATGPDGALWFTENVASKIGRVAMDGAITEYSIPTLNAGPRHITTGPEGALWFTEFLANKIGMLAPSGAFSEYALPASEEGCTSITKGPDSAMWFTEYYSNNLARGEPRGQVGCNQSIGSNRKGVPCRPPI
jgi:hypothetical protein